MNSTWMSFILVVLVAVIVLLYWPWKDAVEFEVPPVLAGDQYAACPDNQLISKVTSDLRLKLAASQGWDRWRTLCEPAQHVLALSWVENDYPPGVPTPAFLGFASVIANKSPNMATLEEIARAYQEIGAQRVSEVVKTAAEIAATPAAQEAAGAGGSAAHAPFIKVDGQFRQQVQHDDTLKLLRAYIRAHSAEIAAAHPGS